MMLTNFFMIVGGQKCGTTSMHNWLDQHPDICMSKPKEPKFFEIDYWRGDRWYETTYYHQHNMLKAPATFHGEARVQNMLVKYVPDRIKLYDPNTKIVIMLRNPIDRYISAWNHFKVMRPGREPRSLEQAINDSEDNFDLDCFDSEEKFYANLDPKGGPYGGRYMEHGMYVKLIRRYHEMFEIHVIIMEDLVNAAEYEYLRLLNFLGARTFTPRFVKLNQKLPKYGDLASRKRLHDFYKNSVYELSNFLHRDLNHLWEIHDDTSLV